MGNSTITGSLSINLAPDTFIATGRTRAHLSVPHLLGAAAHARHLAQIEAVNADEPFGNFYEELTAAATAAVMMATAGIEAHINELYADAELHFSASMMKVWAKGAEDIDRKSIIEKSEWFLILREKRPLERNLAVTQNVKALITLRNALVHFRPEWTSEQDRHKVISRILRDKFPPLKWLAGDPGIFPRAWASYACGSWAVATSVQYIDELSSRAELPSRLQKFRERLSTLPQFDSSTPG